MDRRVQLLALADCVGPLFGTEDFCLFLYSFMRMQAPHTVVELGTGLGASAFAMALAAKLNGHGHIWSIDDLAHFENDITLVGKIVANIQKKWQVVLNARNAKQYFLEIAKCLDVQDVITFVHDRIELDEPGHFDRYKFGNAKIDLLFSDFRHSARDVLAILGHFLPRMSLASSIFIDSASTSWPSYLLLEQLVMQLNQGTIPMILQNLCTADLGAVLRNRRITLVHLTETKDRDQNSTSWLKLEPIDLQPHPQTRMRGLC
jgi:hypothetical protein